MPHILQETVENSLLFTGDLFDQSGLIYLRARYYDPKTGRFVSSDKYKGEIADPSSQNSYAYCGNNPVNYVDPSGYTLTVAALPWAAGISQIDSPVPGPADAIAGGLLLCAALVDGGIWLYDKLTAPSTSNTKAKTITDTSTRNNSERITLYHYGYEMFLESYLTGMLAGTYYTMNPLMSGEKATEILALPLESKGFKNPDIVISVSMPKSYYVELQSTGKVIGPRVVEAQNWSGQNPLLGGGIEIIINVPLIQGTNGVLIKPFRRNI